MADDSEALKLAAQRCQRLMAKVGNPIRWLAEHSQDTFNLACVERAIAALAAGESPAPEEWDVIQFICQSYEDIKTTNIAMMGHAAVPMAKKEAYRRENIAIETLKTSRLLGLLASPIEAHAHISKLADAWHLAAQDFVRILMRHLPETTALQRAVNRNGREASESEAATAAVSNARKVPYRYLRQCTQDCLQSLDLPGDKAGGQLAAWFDRILERGEPGAKQQREVATDEDTAARWGGFLSLYQRHSAALKEARTAGEGGVSPALIAQAFEESGLREAISNIGNHHKSRAGAATAHIS